MAHVVSDNWYFLKSLLYIQTMARGHLESSEGGIGTSWVPGLKLVPKRKRAASTESVINEDLANDGHH